MELNNFTACTALLSALKSSEYLNFGRLIGNAANLCAIFAVLRYGTKFKNVHFNARLLFKAHLWWIAFTTFTYGIIITADLIRFSIERNKPCYYFIPVSLSFTISVVGYVGRFGQIYSMLSIAGERLVASFTYQDYSSHSNPKTTMLVILLQALLSVTSPLLILVWNRGFSGYILLITTKYPGTEARTYDINISIGAISTLTLVIFNASYFAAKINSQRAKRSVWDLFNSQIGLSAQYQLNELKKCLRLYIPLIWIHFICVLSATLIRIAAEKLPETRTSYIVKQSRSFIYYIYPIAIAFMIFFKFQYVMKIYLIMQLKKPQPAETNNNEAINETNLYFMQLQNQLNALSDRR